MLPLLVRSLYHTLGTFPWYIKFCSFRKRGGFFRRGLLRLLYIWLKRKTSTRAIPRKAMIGNTPVLSLTGVLLPGNTSQFKPPGLSCMPLALSADCLGIKGAALSKPIDNSFCCLKRFLKHQWSFISNTHMDGCMCYISINVKPHEGHTVSGISISHNHHLYCSYNCYNPF